MGDYCGELFAEGGGYFIAIGDLFVVKGETWLTGPAEHGDSGSYNWQLRRCFCSSVESFCIAFSLRCFQCTN